MEYWSRFFVPSLGDFHAEGLVPGKDSDAAPSSRQLWQQLRETKNSGLNIPTAFGVNFCARNTVRGALPPTASTAANYFLFHYFEKPAGQFGD